MHTCKRCRKDSEEVLRFGNAHFCFNCVNLIVLEYNHNFDEFEGVMITSSDLLQSELVA